VVLQLLEGDLGELHVNPRHKKPTILRDISKDLGHGMTLWYKTHNGKGIIEKTYRN
jgi:hypothetical protein